jgi:hypothetical protein
MEYNSRIKQYLQEMQAVLIESKYKVFDIDFTNLKALVNKQDTYMKRNGKKCHVEHKFGRWISFQKEDVSYGFKSETYHDSSVHGLEVGKTKTRCKFLKNEVKERIVAEYLLTKQSK